jgi:septum formation protein
MKKIILASASPQRRKLFKIFKLPFTVKKSKAEEVLTIRTSVADLVKENALIKALDIAKETKGDAIVIGADTVVYAKGKLVLKPGNLKDAKKNLKILMAEPHWVYTGVAIVDTRTKKTLVDYDKTRVFMAQLSDDEIDRYHREVSPLDKAGGFDIEGRGGLFIPRIEGCYFNVVGLPIAKLCQMLKKFGVHALMLVLMFSGSSCSGLMTNFNTATNEQERTVYTTEDEQKVGDSVAREFEKLYQPLDDVALNTRVDRILARLAAVCDRKELIYSAKVVEPKEDKRKRNPEKEVNAVSLPGGYIYVFKDLADLIKSDDELAAVIGHEMGHITARHSMKRLQASHASLLLVLAAVPASPTLAAGLSTAVDSMFLEFSQEDEMQADELGIKYMKSAGYDPQGMVKLLEKLQDYDRKQPIRPKSYGRTHPYTHERIANANRLTKGDLSFRDWVRLTGEREEYKK